MNDDRLTDARDGVADLGSDVRAVENDAQAALGGIGELARDAQGLIRKTAEEAKAFSGILRSELHQSIRSALTDGGRLQDMLKGLALGISGGIADRAINALSGSLAGALTTGFENILPFAKGGVVESGRVRAFARGGVLSGPAAFPMADGIGLAGEAGPEAILPLSRGADGRLGVASAGGGAPVIVNIQTPDIEGFRRSQTQVAASLARAVDRGRRNL